jgi:hypothetical protein
MHLLVKAHVVLDLFSSAATDRATSVVRAVAAPPELVERSRVVASALHVVSDTEVHVSINASDELLDRESLQRRWLFLSSGSALRAGSEQGNAHES